MLKKNQSSGRLVLPKHIVIIPDGNRRWAKIHGLRSIEGHKKGLERAKEIAKAAEKLGIKFTSIWGFSTENWQRSKREINYLMRAFKNFLVKNIEEFNRDGARLLWLGRRDRVPKWLKTEIEKAEKLTAKNNKYFVNLCLDYGGRDEIVRSIRKIVSKGLKPEEITEEVVSQSLDTAGLPDPDLLIRTSGEKRTSGIMPWQTVYCEFYFANVYFPDFSPRHLKRAILEFSKRQRRFGS